MDLEVPVAAEMNLGFARAKMMRTAYHLSRSAKALGSYYSRYRLLLLLLVQAREATHSSLILDALSLSTFPPTDSYFLRDFPEDLWPVGFLRFS